MTIHEFYNNEECLKTLEMYCRWYYNNSVYYLIKKHYDYNDFISEVNVMIIKYFNNYDSNYSIKRWISQCVSSTANNLLTYMNTQKNGELTDNELCRFDYESEDDNGNEVLKVQVGAMNNFCIEKFINYATKDITNMTDKKICTLYLLGYKMIDIAKILHLTPRQVRYKISAKTRTHLQKKYLDYKEEII